MEKHRDKYGYTLLRDGLPECGRQRRYRRQELEWMTTHQLREICREEKIICGVIDPLDKEALVRVILRYRGADASHLIRSYDPDGMAALRSAVASMRLQESADLKPECGAKLVVYNGLALDFYDGVTIGYHAVLAGTNALVVSAEGQLCGVLNVEAKGGCTEVLYLTKAAELPCEEAQVKEYSLLLLDRASSELVRRIYDGACNAVPERLSVYRAPLLDFSVCEPTVLTVPPVIDFGAAHTVAGVYLDSLYFERRGLKDGQAGLNENAVNYALFYDSTLDLCETALLPSAVGVLAVEDEDAPRYLFGHEALRLANASYIDEGFCVFYDIKRWMEDCEKREEVFDREGRRTFVERKELLRAYFLHVVAAVQNRFKCRVEVVHILCPVKQPVQFRQALAAVVPEYAAVQDERLDEGVAVLYGAIAERIAKGQIAEQQMYRALLLECGAGAANLSSYVFSVSNRRVSYKIDIEAAYENGDPDFGGNRLTFRVLQLLKLKLFHVLAPQPLRVGVKTVREILAAFDSEVFRCVDESGTEAFYAELEREYAKAEAVLPTRFGDWEKLSRSAYYQVKNNFYFLFDTAERIKRVFCGRADTLQVLLTAGEAPPTREQMLTLTVDKWKLSVREKDSFAAVRMLPEIYFSAFEIAGVLRAEVYGVVRKFLEELYERDELGEFALVKLAGQSCGSELFREALKEFVPGKTMRFKRSGAAAEQLALKTAAVDGALRYLRDRKYGFAAVTVKNNLPRLPYSVMGHTHTGREVVLLHGRRRGKNGGNLSRYMDDLTLQLYLKDMEGRRRCTFVYSCGPDEFQALEYAAIRELYGENIPQAETDGIEGNEVKFFVWSEPQRWGFFVVPVHRGAEQTAELLMLGREQFFRFENESWLTHFFDGTK